MSLLSKSPTLLSPLVSERSGDARYGFSAARRAGFALSNAGFSTAMGFSEATIRMPVTLPVAPKRWRLHLRNGYFATTPGTSFANVAGAISFTGAWVGEHSYTTSGNSVGLGTGNTKAAPVSVLSAFTTPADGSEYVSPWVTINTGSGSFQPMRESLLSLGFTGAPNIVYSTGPSCWIVSGAGSSAQAPNQTATGIALSGGTRVLFDMWIEYEFDGVQPVGIAIGDSRTWGYSVAGPTSNNPNFLQPNTMPTTWPNLYSLMSGYPIINMAYSGAFSVNFVPAYQTLAHFAKWGIGSTIRPDFAIVELGVNDDLNNQTVTTIEANMVSIYDSLRALGIPRIYGATTPPGAGYTGGTYPWLLSKLTSASLAGATSIFTDLSFTAGTPLIIDEGSGTSEFATVAAGGSTGGSSPYNTPLTAALANAHAVNLTVWSRAERWRKRRNDWMRTVPYGLTGVVDIDRAMRDPASTLTVDPVFDTGDHLHFNPNGYARIAGVMPTGIVLRTT